MEQVFVLTSGCYSAYDIVGVFSTKANAEAYKKAFPDRDYNDIEEFNIDPLIATIPQGKSLFNVEMRRDGHALVGDPYGTDPQEPYLREDSTYENGRDVSLGKVLWGRVWAKDKLHAAKILGEKRAQLIAENLWPPDEPGVAERRAKYGDDFYPVESLDTGNESV